jgi:hypothetical protein
MRRLTPHIGLRQLRLSSATWADVDQTIEPRIIPLDSLSQNVLLGVVLVSANNLVPAGLDRLPMADDSLHVAMFSAWAARTTAIDADSTIIPAKIERMMQLLSV